MGRLSNAAERFSGASTSHSGVNGIERIQTWATANAGKSEEQLRLKALEDDLTESAWWYGAERQVETLVREKNAAVYDVMKKCLEKNSLPAKRRAEVLWLFQRHDPKRAKGIAPKYLADGNRAVRQAAALIAFQTGNKTAAIPVLADVMAHDEQDDHWYITAAALRDDRGPAAKAALAGMFANPWLPHGRTQPRAVLLAKCAANGMDGPYRFYLAMLETSGNELPVSGSTRERPEASVFDVPVAVAFAREVVQRFAPDDPTAKSIGERFPKDTDQIPHLKAWLRKRTSEAKSAD